MCGLRSVSYRFVNFGLGDVVIPAKVGDLGAEGVGCSVKPGNVDGDNSVDIGEGYGHFPDFFKDDVVG